jgi:hypothetical protein
VHDGSLPVAELSRPKRQFKEDLKEKNKAAGRKQVHEQEKSKQVNWFSPFLWTTIEIAARRAGKPWSPRAIRVEAQRLNPIAFATLTDQVVGRWFDREARKNGSSKWSDAVVRRVKKGNSPGGESTRTGVLVSEHNFRKTAV